MKKLPAGAFAFIFILILAGMPTRVIGQNLNRQTVYGPEPSSGRRILLLPGIPGRNVLKADLHMHTVFSDGDVWPGTRVEEAWADGLDVISITDHDRYKPHSDNLKSDNRTPFALAEESARSRGILLIPGIEVTRRMPPGHFNAYFVTDPNLPDLTDTSRAAFLRVMEQLNSQGALISWNHPGWIAQQKDTVRWFDIHEQLFTRKWLHCIEIFNYNEWYPVALGWAVNRGLAPLANSDIHAPVGMAYGTSGETIRPMTLILVKEPTPDGVKEALKEQASVAWFNGQLAGSPEWLSMLFEQTLQVKQVSKSETHTRYEFANPTDLRLTLKVNADGLDDDVALAPRSASILKIKTGIREIRVEVTNWHTGMKENLVRTLILPGNP